MWCSAFSRLDFRSGDPGTILNTVIFTRQSSSAFNQMKSLRYAHWQLLIQFVARRIVNSACYSKRSANDQRRTSGSVASLTQLATLFYHSYSRQLFSELSPNAGAAENPLYNIRRQPSSANIFKKFAAELTSTGRNNCYNTFSFYKLRLCTLLVIRQTVTQLLQAYCLQL